MHHLEKGENISLMCRYQKTHIFPKAVGTDDSRKLRLNML
jgi:hypothetical protein